MKTVQQKMDEFKQMTYDERYQVVLQMLQILKDGNENFKYVYENIQTLEHPNDHLLEVVYQEIIELAETKREETTRLEHESFVKMKSVIDGIRKKEEEDMKGENPDELLKNI